MVELGNGRKFGWDVLEMVMERNWRLEGKKDGKEW